MTQNDLKDFDWTEVLIDSSRQLVDIGISLVEQQPHLFPSLFELAMNGKGKHSQRAARIAAYVIIKYENMYKKYYYEILNELENISDESKKFIFLKIFSECKLPEDDEQLGLLTKICFDAIEAKVERIAIKVYAIDILYKISQTLPDIKRELMHLLEKYMLGAKAAYICRASKTISKLRKELGIKGEWELER